MKTNLPLAAVAALHCLALTLSGCNPATAGPQASAKRTAPAPQAGDVKLTKYDKVVASPQIATGRDGTIHVAFVEATKPGIEDFVFDRSSTDGGKSWTETKNLSEDMPGRTVGPVRLAVNRQGSVYAVWRAAAIPYLSLDPSSHQTRSGCNLVYRVLSGGQWSAILPVNDPQANQEHQRIGAGSFFAGADPAGKVHVAYVLNTNISSPELMFGADTKFPQHAPGMGNGSIAEVDLDGAQHSKPREAFLTPVVKAPNANKCDGLDMLDGYFDQSGAPHFVATASMGVAEPFGQTRIVICENGQQSPVVTLPGPSPYRPYLLLDAQGHNHVIVDFAGGEQHSIRDYVAGTGQYTVIKTEKPIDHPLTGFQAGQGPAGTGVVVMELNETAAMGDGETWIAVYDGKAWRPDAQVTNYKNQASGSYKATGTRPPSRPWATGRPARRPPRRSTRRAIYCSYMRETSPATSRCRAEALPSWAAAR